MSKSYFTSESVTCGHPDKLCDRIADEILDEIILAQPADTRQLARSAVEVMALPGMVVIGGEVTCDGYVDIPAVARKAIKSCGYDGPAFGFDGNTCGVITAVNEQSPDIARAVNRDHKLGAGDQGLMFGYACDETPELMPLPIMVAHRLAATLSRLRRYSNHDYDKWLGPDGKTQVTVQYENGKPIAIKNIVISIQHHDLADMHEMRNLILEKVIAPVSVDYGNIDFSAAICPTGYLLNPSGRFVKGGPCADTGLTGRKIIVDTYGGYSRHGGGSFSGKDGTKLDRSGAYMARHIAKSVVASGLARCCEVQLAYIIGLSEPVSVRVDTFGTGRCDERDIEDAVRQNFDLTPGGIIDALRLFDSEAVRFADYSAFGHFGYKSAPWEQVKKLEVY